MPRRVKCQITGAFGTSDTFYRAPNGKYYASEALYSSYKKMMKEREEVLTYFLSTFLGIEKKPGMKVPGLLLKKIKEYEGFYGYDVLLDCLEGERRRIAVATSRIHFESETGKISYIFAIVDNYINGYLKKKRMREEQLKKAAASEGDAPETELTAVSHREKDIRGWLDDEEDS